MIPVYCFTGTGNSLSVARRLAAALGGEVRSMARALAADEHPVGERVGLVYPTYMYRPPHLVSAFFGRLRPGASAFAVLTHGGDPGGVFARTQAALAARGVELTSAHGVETPGNYTPFGGPGSGEEVAELLAAAEARVDAIAAEIAGGARHRDPPSGNMLTRGIYPGLWYKLGHWAIPMTAQKFWLNDGCAKCGACARVCPVGNVEMVDGRPRWGKKCEQCLACMQWCRKGAIELGKDTAGVPRYHHPRVARKEIIAFHGRGGPAGAEA
jgi:ferredoxin